MGDFGRLGGWQRRLSGRSLTSHRIARFGRCCNGIGRRACRLQSFGLILLNIRKKLRFPLPTNERLDWIHQKSTRITCTPFRDHMLQRIRSLGFNFKPPRFEISIIVVLTKQARKLLQVVGQFFGGSVAHCCCSVNGGDF